MFSGAYFDASCSNTDACSGANQMCDTTCKCVSAAITNTAGNGCILSRFYNHFLLIYICMLSGVAYGDACGADSECTDDSNQACNINCECKTTAIRNTADDACILSRFYNRITKTEWVNEPSLNIHLQKPKCCSTPVLLP